MSNPKILMLCVMAVDSSDIPLFLSNELRKLGCEVELMTPVDENSLAERILHNSGYRLGRTDLWLFGKRVINIASEFKPDVLFVYGSNYYLSPKAIAKIKRMTGCIVVLLEGNIQFWRWYQGGAISHYDYCFAMDSFAVELLKGPMQKTQTFFLGTGCDPEFHYPAELTCDEQKHYGADVMFLGSAFPERLSLMENLAEFDIKLWGRHWDRSPRLSGFFVDEPMYGVRKCKAYRASKISLNLQNPVSQVNGVSCRIFEILACGGFPMTENKKDLSLYFDVGKEIATFEDADDLKKKIEYYLEHPDEREEIARRGRERVLREHTYKHRMEKMLEIIGSG